jgi:hypothetical protein
MNEQEFVDYFRALAEAFRPVAHSSSEKRFATVEEFIESPRSLNTAKMVLIVGNESGSIDGLGQGGALEAHYCSVALLRKAKAGSYPDIQAAYTETMDALRKVLGKMAKDKKELAQPMLWLRLEGLQFRKVGPQGDLLYGMEAKFTISPKGGMSYQYRPEDWL